MSDDTAGLFDYKTVKNGYSLIPERYAGLYNITSGESGIAHQRLITIFLIAISVVGCFGNILICYVIIINKHMRTAINYYLLSQAVSDSMFLLSFSYAAIFCMKLSSLFPESTVRLVSIIFKLVHYMGCRASVLVKMTIAFDRYVAICHPLMTSTLQAKNRTVKIILVIWAISLLLSSTHVACLDIPHIKCSWFEIFFYAEFNFLAIFPIAFIAVTYAQIGCKIRKSSQFFKNSISKQNSMTDNKPKRKGIDISVIVILEYLICWSPFALMKLLCTYHIIDSSLLIKNILWLLIVFSLYFLSTVINPILYSLMCLKFRKAFKELLCCYSEYKRCDHVEVN